MTRHRDVALLPQHQGPNKLRPRRPVVPMMIYISSILLSLALFYSSATYCREAVCEGWLHFPESYKHHPLYVPIIISPMIGFISSIWLLINIFHVNTICTLSFSCIEMPCAVFCSLASGISAVVIIHYAFEFIEESWLDGWCWATACSIVLGADHAVLAFALQ